MKKRHSSKKKKKYEDGRRSVGLDDKSNSDSSGHYRSGDLGRSRADTMFSLNLESLDDPDQPMFKDDSEVGRHTGAEHDIAPFLSPRNMGGSHTKFIPPSSSSHGRIPRRSSSKGERDDSFTQMMQSSDVVEEEWIFDSKPPPRAPKTGQNAGIAEPSIMRDIAFEV